MIWTETWSSPSSEAANCILDASAGGLSVEPNQEGERVDRSSEGESGKTDILLTCMYILVHCTRHLCLQKMTQR